MASPRIKGNPAITHIHTYRVKDAINGWTRVHKYSGLLNDLLSAQETEFYTGGAVRSVVDQDGEGAVDGVLTVEFAARSQEDALEVELSTNASEFSNTWTYGSQREQINIWELPKYKDLADIESGYLERIRQAVDEYKRKVASGITNKDTNKDLVFTLSNFITLKGSAEQFTTASELSSSLLAGKTTADRDRSALRNVRVVPGNSSLVADTSNVNQMWTNEKLIQFINSTATAITQRTLIGDLSTSFDNTYWFKVRPDINEMSDNRFEIVTEWINYEDKEFETTVHSIYS